MVEKITKLLPSQSLEQWLHLCTSTAHGHKRRVHGHGDTGALAHVHRLPSTKVQTIDNLPQISSTSYFHL
jgi:hypothetical protein